VIVVTAIYGEHGTGELLILSQVVLSMQLPFAVIPLVMFVSDRRKMGAFAIPRSVAVLAWIVAAVIVALNLKLLADILFG
jgi:manganese transport protein